MRTFTLTLAALVLCCALPAAAKDKCKLAKQLHDPDAITKFCKNKQSGNSGCAQGLKFVQGLGCVQPGTTSQPTLTTQKQSCDVIKAGESAGVGCASGPPQCEKLSNGDTLCCCTIKTGQGGGVGQ